MKDKNFVNPKVVVAFVTGWSDNPEGTDGEAKAASFYNSVMLTSSPVYFNENTALRKKHNSRLPRGSFRVELFFVETANPCK
jgi:hypothetical protein